jgi:hypothetical protein
MERADSRRTDDERTGTGKLHIRSIIIESLCSLRGDPGVRRLWRKARSGTNGPTGVAISARFLASHPPTGFGRQSGARGYCFSGVA